MIIGFKLTTQNLQGWEGFQYCINKKVYAKGEIKIPLTDGVIHYYADPLLSILVNCGHGNINNPRLWKCEIINPLGCDGLQRWSRGIKILKEEPLPLKLTLKQKLNIVKELYKHRNIKREFKKSYYYNDMKILSLIIECCMTGENAEKFLIQTLQKTTRLKI